MTDLILLAVEADCSLLLVTSSDIQKCDKNFAEELYTQAAMQASWWAERAATVALVASRVVDGRTSRYALQPPKTAAEKDYRPPQKDGYMKAPLRNIGLPKLLCADKAHGGDGQELIKAAKRACSRLPVKLPSSSISRLRPMTSDQRSARFRAFLGEGENKQSEQGGAPQWNAAVFWDARGTTQPGTQRSFKAQWWVARSQKEFEIPVLLPFATRKISAAKHTSDRERVSTRAPREMRVNSLLREYGVTGLSAGAGGL